MPASLFDILVRISGRSSSVERSPKATGGIMFFVYILKSRRNGRFYTGSTNDVTRRLKEHNSGQSKYTKHTAPFELVYKEDYKTKSQAYRRELFLKSGKGRKFIKSLNLRA